MQVHQIVRGRIGRLFVTVVALILLGAWSVPSAFAATGAKKKPLSMPDVTVIAGTTAGALPLWVAMQQGFFKQQGVNVTWLNTSNGASSTTTVLLAGSGQFTIDSAPNQVIAAQGGAPIRGLVQANYDAAQEVSINATTAAKKGIPAVANSTAGAVKQLMALKGSHLTIAESSTSSTSYSWLVTIALEHGLKIGSAPNDDFNITTVGSVTAEVAALDSNRVDGFGNVPPYTVLPNVIEIPLWRIPPATNSAGQYLSTTTNMVNQHTDTVQAVTTGFVEGMNYMVTHPVQAQRDVSKVFSSVGITSPEEQNYLFADFLPFVKNPFPSKSSYTNGLALINGAQASPVSLPYSQFIVSRFVTAAGKALNIKLN